MERTIICISRQYGSGGREIGEAVAKKLGIPCYDKCLIQKAAQEAGLSETAVAEYDEKGEDFGIAVSGNPFADTAALGEAFYSEEARVFEAERRAILELADILKNSLRWNLTGMDKISISRRYKLSVL